MSSQSRVEGKATWTQMRFESHFQYIVPTTIKGYGSLWKTVVWIVTNGNEFFISGEGGGDTLTCPWITITCPDSVDWLITMPRVTWKHCTLQKLTRTGEWAGLYQIKEPFWARSATLLNLWILPQDNEKCLEVTLGLKPKISSCKFLGKWDQHNPEEAGPQMG